jgi:hypothetical protein
VALLVALRGGDGVLGLFGGGFGFGEHGAGVFRRGLKFTQTIALLEARGGGGRRARDRNVAVPAEEIARGGDETLTGLQLI